MTDETVLFLVHNGGEYSDYSVLALFTDKTLADEFAKASEGIVEEWPANVPKTKWMTASARMAASKIDGVWEVSHTVSRTHFPFIAEKKVVVCELGHFSKWNKPDPKTGQYTEGHVSAVGQSEEEVRKMCLDAFWKKVAELEGQI